MTSNELKKLIGQIRKYGLESAFDTPSDFDKWLNDLSDKEIKNFNSLNVKPSDIKFSPSYLINKNLLNCEDYPDRIKAMIKLKNADGWYHLFGSLCSPNFLNSKNYYEDMEMISKAETAQFPLWIVGEDDFINSPYHREDLKLIVEAKDTPKEKKDEVDDLLVMEALTVVAGSANSINSPYHREDMQLIAKSGSECLQSSCSYPKSSLNNLAIDDVSLKDKYHLENMQILAKRPVSDEYLYKLMTDPEIIKGNNYRNEINALAAASSLIKAIAIYLYISNSDDITRNHYESQLWDLGVDFIHTLEIKRNNSEKGCNNPNYLKYLKLLNQIDDKWVLFVESLLSDKDFSKSQYCNHDLNVLLSSQDQDIFMDIYRFLHSKASLNSPHHIKDLDIISKTTERYLRGWLIEKATNEVSLNSPHHEYDMEYISKLNLRLVNDKVVLMMRYYLFRPNGINHPEHIERLEKLSRGEIVKSEDAILIHLEYLEKNANNFVETTEKNNVNVPHQEKPKVFSKIRDIFKKK